MGFISPKVIISFGRQMPYLSFDHADGISYPPMFPFALFKLPYQDIPFAICIPHGEITSKLGFDLIEGNHWSYEDPIDGTRLDLLNMVRCRKCLGFCQPYVWITPEFCCLGCELEYEELNR